MTKRLSIHDSHRSIQFAHWNAERSDSKAHRTHKHASHRRFSQTLFEFGKGMQNGSRSITTRAGSNLSSEYKINVNFWLNTERRRRFYLNSCFFDGCTRTIERRDATAVEVGSVLSAIVTRLPFGIAFRNAAVPAISRYELHETPQLLCPSSRSSSASSGIARIGNT